MYYYIHKAKIVEIPEIKDLLRVTWGQTYGSLFSIEAIDKITSEWHNAKFLSEQINDKTIYFIVAKNKAGKIVGMATGREIEVDGRIMLDRLYVLPDFQGKGIGSALLQDIEKHFRGLTEMFVAVESLNTKALEFYKRHDFRIYENDQEEVIGDKKLKVTELVKKY